MNNLITHEEKDRIDQVCRKYQYYFNVWTPEFNLDGFNELVDEIRDGLR
jgi:hypothetical protein